MDPSTVNTLIIASTALIAITVIAAVIGFIIVGKTAFQASSPAAAGSFGLLFLALPALSTIVLIVLTTAVLTVFNFLSEAGCIAILSSIASFVLGAETQRRRERGQRAIPENSNSKAGGGEGHA
jgi:uncharacterized membrane protein